MIAKVTLLCAVVAFAHAGAPLVGYGGLGYGGLGLASPALGLRTAAIGGLGLASPAYGLGGLRTIGAPAIGLRTAAIGGLGLAASGYGYGGLRTIAAPAIGLRTAAIGGLGLASPAYGLGGLSTIGAPAIGLRTAAIGGLGYGVASHGLAVAAAAPVVAKAVVAHVPQPYEFGYSHHTDDGASSSRQEVSDAGNNKQGSYSIQNPDGTYRVVTYVADAAGFRAVVKTNEHGTAPQNPAATQILAEEPPYKVLPAAAPLVKTAHIGLAATPVLRTAAIGGHGLAYGGLGGLGALGGHGLAYGGLGGLGGHGLAYGGLGGVGLVHG